MLFSKFIKKTWKTKDLLKNVYFIHKWLSNQEFSFFFFIKKESLGFCHDCLPKHAKWNLIRVGTISNGYILPHWPRCRFPLRDREREGETRSSMRADKVCGWNWFQVKQRELNILLLVSHSFSPAATLAFYKNYNPNQPSFLHKSLMSQL